MKLYFAPGACSLSPHIALREAGLPFELEKVDLRAKRTASGADFRAVNPKGYVPALEFDDGRVLTEGAVIVQWVADQRPEANLAPAAGTFERLRLQEWLHFIATELHKGFGPILSKLASEEYKTATRETLTSRFKFLGEAVAARPYLMGEAFSVADGYAFYTMRTWRRRVAEALPAAALEGYFARIAARPAVIAALDAEERQT